MEEEAVYESKGEKKVTSVTLTLDIEPMGAVRTTGKQQFVDERFKKYQAWKDSLRWVFRAALAEKGILASKVDMNVIEMIEFYLPIPKGSKKAKKTEYAERIGEPHMLKPDIDNMLKAVMDGLMKDDKAVHTVGKMRKVWAEKGSIVMTINLVQP